MTIYLVRHGADDNTKRGGWSNHPLTEEGLKQSEELARELKDCNCNAEIIYSSDLLRARQTAKILAQYLNLEVEYNTEFREVNNGYLAGMDNELADKLYPSLYWRKQWEQHYPNGESPKEFYERIKFAWDKLVESCNKSIILVTHSGVINVIMHLVNGVEYLNKNIVYKIGTADYIKLIYQIDLPEGKMQQNIYNNDEFFENYKNTRLSDNSFNKLLEQPAMIKLIPDVQGKSVLDLGCGFGFNCKEFSLAGAKSVVGIDLSEKMIEEAKATNNTDNITYQVMSMVDIDTLNEKFDFVFSSLAFHYIEDFEKLISKIYSVLNYDGILLFSQEHPIVTAVKNNGENYVKKLNGSIKGVLLNNYADISIRKEKWFGDGVEKYHRTFSFIINTLIKCGFTIEAIDEPLPSEEALQMRNGLKKEFIKPTFLIVKAKKALYCSNDNDI